MQPLYHKALTVIDETREKLVNELKEQEDSTISEINEISTVEERDNTTDSSQDVSEIPPLFT